MSHPSSTETYSARQIAQLTKKATAHLTGTATRGPDHGEGRRVPHRDSFDVADPRARPWARIGDGSVGQGIAHIEALLQAAEQWYHQGWRETPAADVRAARSKHAELEAELETLAAASPADVPPGRPATIRQELCVLEKVIDRGDRRLRRIDVSVLKALLQHLDFASGRLIPEHETIADVAGCHVNSVKASLRRLKDHGLISWVRRTIRTGNEHERGPQREQTSNAYHFEHRQKMPSRLWHRYAQILARKLSRIGRAVAALTNAPAASLSAAVPAMPGASELRSAVASLGSSIHNART
ncbi:helix-turn-helix domain-containing protein [Sphingomonas yunnanensis]|uniref:helix-turn-helix domain-containing protein n=1 Tax=Sphingomonas yunnanensis TaxID=310400 RepID=UPI001CA747A1|nr:helix-turn-helix domain-containing protein [Sphingomonas yunnanensis]MBY9062450.1 helix-turn-helix domain-containing protein [Sphingomonas yunnanensis]